MAEHTPGPWDIYDGHDGQLGHYNIDAAGAHGAAKQVIAVTIDHREVDAANARLIAAAPQLLRALEDVAAQRGDWLGAANSAIAQAREVPTHA